MRPLYQSLCLQWVDCDLANPIVNFGNASKARSEPATFPSDGTKLSTRSALDVGRGRQLPRFSVVVPNGFMGGYWARCRNP